MTPNSICVKRARLRSLNVCDCIGKIECESLSFPMLRCYGVTQEPQLLGGVQNENGWRRGVSFSTA